VVETGAAVEGGTTVVVVDIYYCKIQRRCKKLSRAEEKEEVSKFFKLREIRPTCSRQQQTKCKTEFDISEATRFDEDGVDGWPESYFCRIS